jgi:NAD(P)-dependent dehydrogenase (short-subunit alcohol dehydrogenase family)
MTTAVVPLMPRGGVIVNTTSVSALHPHNGSGMYGSSKLALVYLTQVFARELAHLEIRVCAVGPGAVDTPMAHRQMAGLADTARALRASVEATQLINRIAQPEEIAAAMGYLASEDGAYCTGTTLWIDGGVAAK